MLAETVDMLQEVTRDCEAKVGPIDEWGHALGDRKETHRFTAPLQTNNPRFCAVPPSSKLFSATIVPLCHNNLEKWNIPDASRAAGLKESVTDFSSRGSVSISSLPQSLEKRISSEAVRVNNSFCPEFSLNGC